MEDDGNAVRTHAETIASDQRKFSSRVAQKLVPG